MFYKRFMDDIINRRRKNQPDKLLQNLSNNHANVNYTVEVYPEKFLYTKRTPSQQKYCIKKKFVNSLIITNS